MPVYDFAIPTDWQINLSELKWDQITESAGSVVGDISTHQGNQAVSKGVARQTKINYL